MPLPPIKQLVMELEAALRPRLGPEKRRDCKVYRPILGWPQVSHPAIVRAWLDFWSVVELGHDGWRDSTLGTLADPEAAGWALMVARGLERGSSPAEVYKVVRQHPRWGEDSECRRYAMAVLERAGLPGVEPERHGVAEVRERERERGVVSSRQGQARKVCARRCRQGGARLGPAGPGVAM